MKSVLTFCLTLMLLQGCNSLHDEALLHGQWKTQMWMVLSTGQEIPNKMDFTFNPDGKYVVDYGSQDENGTYYIAGEFLHTKETDAAEKSVKIKLLTTDSLIFEMNRAGSLEQVLLLKSY